MACIGITHVAAGEGFSCGLLSDGKVRCFGSPEGGKLGQQGARRVAGLRGVVDLALGAQHTCALLADRTVACWGSNAVRQLGDDTKDMRGYPMPVPKLEKVAQIAAGQLFSCARLDDGAVACWGDNEFGQLGTGPAVKPKVTVPAAPQQTGAQDRPSEVVGLSGGELLALGRDHACAVLGDGGVSCWGSDAFQALGRASPPSAPPPKDGARTMMVVITPPRAVKVATLPVVKGLKGAVEIAAGFEHACARLADGSVTCWGHNHHGQLGDGTTKDATAPVKVKGLTGAVLLALGGDHSCAVTNDGTVQCWGAGASGQIGDPAKVDHAEPFPVPDLTEVGALESGARHLCAALANGTFACWGDNAHGELGSGATGEKPSAIMW